MSQATAVQVGEAVRAARQASGETQEAAALELKVSRVAISNYERGMLPEDFIAEKLPILARLYGTTPEAILSAAHASTRSAIAPKIPDNEPIADHIAKFPVPIQVWFHGFLSELLQLGLREDINAAAVERAREQITFAQLDLWAGGGLLASDARSTLRALRWCAEAAWRSVTDPGWLQKPRSAWSELPAIFAELGEGEVSQPGKARKTSR